MILAHFLGYTIGAKIPRQKQGIQEMAAYELALTDAAVGTDSAAFITTEDTFYVTCYSGGVEIIDVTDGDNDDRVITKVAAPFTARDAAKGFTLGIGLSFKVKSTTTEATTCGVAF